MDNAVIVLARRAADTISLCDCFVNPIVPEANTTVLSALSCNTPSSMKPRTQARALAEPVCGCLFSLDQPRPRCALRQRLRQSRLPVLGNVITGIFAK